MTGTEVRSTVAEVLAALDEHALLPLLPAEEAAMLAGPVARVAAGVDLSVEDQRAAARLLAAAGAWLEGPLTHLGLSIPPPPEPVVHRAQTSAAAKRLPEAFIADGGQRIGIRYVRHIVEVIRALPGARPALANRWYVDESQVPGKYTCSIPATPAAAHNLLTTLDPFGYKVSKGVSALADQFEEAADARRFLVDGAPLPDVDPGTYGVHAELWGHQHRAVSFGEASAATLMAIKMGGGKALDLATPVPTPSGWTTMGALVDGDEVFDERGQICRVVQAHPVRHDRPCYEVEFSDGEVIVADGEHLWFTETRADRAGESFARWYGSGSRPRGAVRSTEDIRASLRVGKRELTNHSVPVAQPLTLPDVELPVTPYVLGVWLGDGSSRSGVITTADGVELRELLAAEGYRCGPNLAAPDRAEMFTVYDLLPLLRRLGVVEAKRIPQTYLRASEKQRRALLAGLLDTDGTVCAHGRVQFDNTREALARDVLELALSLGYRATMTERAAKLDGREVGRVWRVTFTTADPVFRLLRKQEAHAARSGAYSRERNRSRYIVDVRPVESRPVRCITVDSPSRLYLAGRAMVPTHNTISAIALANRIQAGTVLIVCPNRVRAVWTREVRERSNTSWHIVDGTRAPMRRGAKRQNLTHPERVAQCNQVLFDCDCGAAVHAFVINYEALLQRVWQEWTPASKLDLVVYDEAHRLKNYKLKVDPPKPGPGKEEKEVRARIAAAKRLVKRGKDGPDERDAIERADELIRAAKEIDARGERERELRRLCAPEEPPLRELRAARMVDRLAAKREAEFRASKLSVSGVAARWVEWSHRRVGLTGTPFPQHPWDIFGLYRALDPGVFGLLWTPFKDEYVEMDKSGTFPKKIKPGMLDEFARLCMSLMYRPVVDLNLPGCTDVVRTVELEDEARKVYDKLDTELWADLSQWVRSGGASVREPDPDADEDGPAEITAHNVLSRLLRLQQLTGGTLRTDPVEDATGRIVPGPEARVSTAKADALAEFDGKTITGGILEEIGCVPGRTNAEGEEIDPEPVIVFCRFKADLDAIKEIATKAGLRYGEISGRRDDGLNADARMAADKDIVAVQIQAGGTGIDLTRARYGIWYSLGYSVSDYDQARARPYRPGQTRPVVFIHLIAEETADAQVYAAIKARKDAVAAVLRAGGVDPSDIDYAEEAIGVDPTAEQVEGIDSSSVAVELPWEGR